MVRGKDKIVWTKKNRRNLLNCVVYIMTKFQVLKL